VVDRSPQTVGDVAGARLALPTGEAIEDDALALARKAQSLEDMQELGSPLHGGHQALDDQYSDR